MNDAQWSELAHAVLDGVASEGDAAQVSAEIERNPARAREFARLALLHDALERETTAGVGARGAARRTRTIALVRRVALVAAVLAFAVAATWFVVGTSPTASASASETLSRIIEVARKGDRTYVLRAIGASARADAPKPGGRPQPTIDDAIVYLRGPSSYVLARLDEAGNEVLSGSDGARAWIVPAKGPVRVSRDASRFAGALPGSKQGVAFIDPHGDLAALAASYDIALAPAASERAVARLVATRKPDARGGPKRVEIAFDPATSVILGMRLDNLPRARGGPRSVEFELVDDAPLAVEFFRHDAHHGADRAVIEED